MPHHLIVIMYIDCHQNIKLAQKPNFPSASDPRSLTCCLSQSIVKCLLPASHFNDSMQFDAIQCNSMQFNAIQCNSIQFNVIPCNSMQFHAMQFNIELWQCNVYQCNASLTPQQSDAIQNFVSTMQCNSMQCKTVQSNIYSSLIQWYALHEASANNPVLTSKQCDSAISNVHSNTNTKCCALH